MPILPLVLLLAANPEPRIYRCASLSTTTTVTVRKDEDGERARVTWHGETRTLTRVPNEGLDPVYAAPSSWRWWERADGAAALLDVPGGRARPRTLALGCRVEGARSGVGPT